MRKIKKYKVKYSAEIKTDKSGIKLWVAEPTNNDYQKISNFYISSKIKSKYKDSNNKIYYLDFPKKDKIKIEFSFDIKNKFFNKKIDINKIQTISKSSNIFKQYTKQTKFLEQTPKIKKLAYSLSKNEKNPYNIAKNIFLYIINNFEYEYPVKKRGVKNLNLKKLKGDCGEYSALFTTLCRINKIPAKINTGFVVFSKKIKEHAWNSIYLKPYGWLDIDTQYGSLEKEKAIEKYFCKTIENRIVFVIDYNIKIKPSIPNNYNTDYWKNNYLPIDKNSSQILQPLIFATRNKVVYFKEKFKIM
ncbi:transglutaminase-like domain-containing protein [Patescibacteria group bacterium]|nr:transglutaminase-like domain-containing protein [Patescibacteria group bacterium]